AFFAHARAPPSLYPLSLHDALPISPEGVVTDSTRKRLSSPSSPSHRRTPRPSTIGTTTTCRWSMRSASRNWRTVLGPPPIRTSRSEEHTSELQSRENLVCRLLLEKK